MSISLHHARHITHIPMFCGSDCGFRVLVRAYRAPFRNITYHILWDAPERGGEYRYLRTGSRISRFPSDGIRKIRQVRPPIHWLSTHNEGSLPLSLPLFQGERKASLTAPELQPVTDLSPRHPNPLIAGGGVIVQHDVAHRWAL